MRSLFARLALLVGVFALVAAGVALFWGKDAAQRTPLSVDSYTRLTGTASGALAKSPDTAVPVNYITHTQADPDASDDDVVAIQQTGCITLAPSDDSPFCIDDEGEFVFDGKSASIVQISAKKVALDRRTALAIEDQEKYIKDEDSVVAYEGLVIKFPFNVEKKTYPYWDGTLGQAVDATYVGDRDIDGLKTYEFQVTIPETTAEIAEGTEGLYEAAQTIWVDPKTGAFIDQVGSQTATLSDGTVAIDIDVAYTDETVETNVKDAEDNGRSLWLVGTVLPIAGLLLGLVLLAVGVLLLRRRQPQSGGAQHSDRVRETV